MKCYYYPGCSQKATSRCYDVALSLVTKTLGIDFIEIPDWSCCGTTVAINYGKRLSLSLSARNLALAQGLAKKDGTEDISVVTPCPSCHISLRKVNEVFEDKNPESINLTKDVKEALQEGGLSYEGRMKARHICEYLLNDVGLDAIKNTVKNPLAGLRIVPYYGCLMTRPKTEGDSAVDPQNLEKLIVALGGEVVNFPLKTACCGSATMVSCKTPAMNLSNEILSAAKTLGGDVVMVACGLCQTNLDLATNVQNKIPVMNFAQLMAIAFGFKEKQVLAQKIDKAQPRSHEHQEQAATAIEGGN